MPSSFTLLERVRQLRNEPRARSMEPRFDRSDRNSLHLRNRFERLMVNLSQDNHAPLLIRKLCDRIFQSAAQLSFLQGPVDALLIRDLIRVFERDDGELRAAPLLQEGPMRHRENPRRQSRSTRDLELRKDSENLREQFLELILRIGRIPPASHQCPQGAGKSAEQFLPRLQVPCLRPFYRLEGYIHSVPRLLGRDA
jgi:hypothetical protein